MIISELKKYRKDGLNVFSRTIQFDSGEEREMWIELKDEDVELYCEDRADGYLVSLLLSAMIRNENLEFKSPISASLLDSIRKYLIPFLCGINKSLRSIEVVADSIEDVSVNNDGLIGTGCSCGVDSLSTFVYHKAEEKDEALKINTLTLFNSGYYGIGDGAQSSYPQYIKRSKEFCSEMNCRFLTVNSNFSDFRETTFLSSHTYLTCAIVLLLQNGFSTYYYSSGYPVFTFRCDFSDPAFYDTFLLSCISTRALKFFSSCCTMNRVEKVKMVLKYPDVAKYLYVCTSGIVEKNCGKCEKCIRTLLAADSLGMLDLLSSCFDTNQFIKKRKLYVGYTIRQKSHNVYYKEIYEEYKANHKVSLICWLYAFLPCHLDYLQLKSNASKIKKKIYNIRICK